MLDILYNDIEAEDIFIEPPDPCVLTDEDFGDENSGDIENLSVCQLRAQVEIKLITSVRIYSQKHKKHINVTRPKLIAQYNQFVGGTDQMDQIIAAYRIGVRGKKWWWPLFTWLLEIPINNSWALYKKANSIQIFSVGFPS